MTVAELITEVLAAIRNQLYADNPKDFFRDQRHLKQAIARYGHACHQRGWEFDVPFVRGEIMRVLLVVKRQEITGYLPVYLQSAIDQHVREHAEELNAEAKAIRTKAAKELAKVRVAPELPRQPSATELLALLYKDIQRTAKARHTKPAAKVKQGELL